MLCRTGLLLERNENTKDLKKQLTVRPIVNTDYGFAPPSFKVYRTGKNSICVPRFFLPSTKHSDKRPEPSRTVFDFVGSLRDSTRQNEAFSKAVDALNKVGGGILSLPCGYGKTTVALAIAAHMKVRTMVIVHKEFLANQWKERIKQFCPKAKIGIVQRNKIEIEGNDVIIAMLQSLSMKDYEFNLFDSIGMVIVDEAHHICAQVFSQAFFKFCPKYTLGLSATPERKDGLTDVLYWFLGPNILTIERENRGKTVVICHPYKCEYFKTQPPMARNGKISLPNMITELTEITERNDYIENLARKYATGSRRILILSERRFHCEELARRLQDLGSGLYMGGMKEKELEESSKQKIIVGTFSQAQEGLDIPVLDTVILSTPKSDVKQAVGRILRETKGKKNYPIILDIKDNWALLPSMHYKRRKMYKESGFEIETEGKDEDDESRNKKQLTLTHFAFIDRE